MAEVSHSKVRMVGFLFIIDFVISIVILFTDKNLQTDFGIVKPYFVHWYGMLVMAIIDIIGAGILIGKPTNGYLKVGTIGSSLLAVFLVADLATYKMVGLSSVSQFATYLFGFSHYPGALSYIPGLYDVLFIFYIITAVVGALVLRSSS